MRKHIDDVVLVRRASQYARHKCPEPARRSLKTRGKVEAVSISEKRSCHGNSEGIGIVWFIADAVRNNDRRVAARGGIHFPNHVIPCVSRRGGFRQTNKFDSCGRTKLIRQGRGESFSDA